MGRCTLGIDIGGSSIKFLLTEKTGKNDIIRDYFIEEIPGTIENREEYIFEKIRETIVLKKWQKYKCTVVISGKEMNIRRIKLPKIPVDELQPVIEREAKKIFGDIEDKKIVFEIMGEITVDERSYYSIFFILFNQEIINRIASAGIKIERVDFGIFAADRVYRDILSQEKNFAIIEFGGQNTDIMIYQGKSLEIFREINIGSDELTETISNMLQVEQEEAEILKRKYGYVSKEHAENSSDESEKELLMKLSFAYQWAFEKLMRKISNSIDYFISQNRGSEVDAVYICGRGAKLLNIDEILREEIGIKEINLYSGMNKFTAAKKFENIREFTEEAPGFTRVFGAALSEKNYISESGKSKKKINESTVKMRKAAAAVILLFPIAALYFYNKIEYVKTGKEIAKVQTNIDTLAPQAARYDELDREAKAVVQDSEKLSSATDYRAAIPDFLYELSRITSERIYFTEINYKDGQVKLTGAAYSEDGFPEVYINEFLKKLENGYGGVKLNSTQKSSDKSNNTASFEIELIIDSGDPALKAAVEEESGAVEEPGAEIQ